MAPSAAPPAIPCATCLHEPVCALKEQIPDLTREAVQDLGSGLRLVSAGVHVECDHHLEAVATSTSGRTVAVAAPSDAERMQISRLRGSAARVAQAREAQAARRHPSRSTEREEKADRAAAVIAAIGRHGGDRRAAAAELGMKLNGLMQIEKHAHRQLVAS